MSSFGVNGGSIFGGDSEYLKPADGGCGCGVDGGYDGVYEGGGVVADMGFTTPYKIMSSMLVVSVLLIIMCLAPMCESDRTKFVLTAGILAIPYVIGEFIAITGPGSSAHKWLNTPFSGDVSSAV